MRVGQLAEDGRRAGGPRLGADRHRAGGEVEAEPAGVLDEHGDVGEVLRLPPPGRHLAHRLLVARRPSELGADLALSGQPGGADDADDLIAEAHLDRLREHSGQSRALALDHGGRMRHDRAHVVFRDRARRRHHRLAERRDRDRDRTRERGCRGSGDLIEVIAGDHAGDHRQGCGPGGGSIRRPVLLRRVALKRSGALYHAGA